MLEFILLKNKYLKWYLFWENNVFNLILIFFSDVIRLQILKLGWFKTVLKWKLSITRRNLMKIILQYWFSNILIEWKKSTKPYFTKYVKILKNVFFPQVLHIFRCVIKRTSTKFLKKICNMYFETGLESIVVFFT